MNLTIHFPPGMDFSYRAHWLMMRYLFGIWRSADEFEVVDFDFEERS